MSDALHDKRYAESRQSMYATLAGTIAQLLIFWWKRQEKIEMHFMRILWLACHWKHSN